MREDGTTADTQRFALSLVDAEEWEAARNELLTQEKALTRRLDELAAQRRRLPAVLVPDYPLVGPAGPTTLTEAFNGRTQLVAYHFMLTPGDPHLCVGCSSFVDNIGHLEHLHARDTTFALISRAPFSEIEAARQAMGWTVPWYSSGTGAMNEDFGLSAADGERFGLSVFIRTPRGPARSYFTSDRGVDRLRLDFSLLDLTPLGRQETWEDSPDGWPQTDPYAWWRLRTQYGKQ